MQFCQSANGNQDILKNLEELAEKAVLSSSTTKTIVAGNLGKEGKNTFLKI